MGIKAICLACVLGSASASNAVTLWYNGDYDLNDADTNQGKVPINYGGSYVLDTSLVYDDFIVPVGQTWTLTNVFSDDELVYSAAPTTATWQIRSGVSAGNGGTLVASGDSAITETLLHAADFNNYLDPEYKVSTAVSGVTLTAGTYWLAVAPDSGGYYGDQSYEETTSGANAVGLPAGNDGNSFVTNNLSGSGALNFAPATFDFSEGVLGTSISVPEPTGNALLAAAAVGALLLARRSARTVGLARVRRSSPFTQMVEPLEPRQLLSTTPVVGAYTPNQVRTAYGVTALGLANEGQGVTIGIVDELDDTDITNDANAFSTEYNLPKLDGLNGDGTMTVFKDTALASVGSASGTGVGAETSLDVEWAHAMAPKANILLVEVPATGTVANEFLELLHGIQVAAQKGADSISLSYGTSESSVGASSVVSQNTTYLSSGAAASVAVSVATGDGSSPSYPATSPNVLAVGGTSLYFSSAKGQYGFETGWGGLAGAGAGGGGQSTNFAAPTFQSTNGVSYAKRATPDVSLVADPVTAVSIYDSLDGGSSPWTSEGGTSVASPTFAGIIALAQQNRLAASLPVLSSVQIDSELYSLYNSSAYTTYFHDITQGSNKDVASSGRTSVTGYSAATGYDLATGLGSPIASTLVPVLSTLVTTSVVHTGKTAGVGTNPETSNPAGSKLTLAAESLKGILPQPAIPVTAAATPVNGSADAGIASVEQTLPLVSTVASAVGGTATGTTGSSGFQPIFGGTDGGLLVTAAAGTAENLGTEQDLFSDKLIDAASVSI